MAIITCPECGQHPISDRAASCPRCGCPIAAPADPPSAEVVRPPTPAERPPTIYEEREARLGKIGSSWMNSSSEYPDGSVTINDSAALSRFVPYIQGWCEELSIGGDISGSHIAQICSLPKIKSIDFSMAGAKLDDESLLRLSKVQNLRKLKFILNDGGATLAGWLRLADLRELEYLELPILPFRPKSQDLNDKDRLKEQLQRLLPRTIIK